jgi:hypothetical protein
MSTKGLSQTTPPPTRDEAFNRLVIGDLSTKGLYIRFFNLRQSGSHVEGDVSIDWEERIAGTRVVLIRGEYHFKTDSEVIIVDESIGIGWGISVRVKARVYVEANPRKLCGEVRASIPGGNIGDIKCMFL